MRAPKVRAPHLGEHRPVAARHAIQPVRMVMVTSLGERAWMVLATVTGVVAAVALGIGIAVIS